MSQAQRSAIVAVLAMFLAGCETQNSTPNESNNYGVTIPAPDDESCAMLPPALDGGAVELQDCGNALEVGAPAPKSDASSPDLYPRKLK